MASSSEAAEGLEAAIAAIPRIAEVIAAIPVEDRARAFGMARRLYLQTAHDLGGGEAAARNLVSTVMRHLLLGFGFGGGGFGGVVCVMAFSASAGPAALRSSPPAAAPRPC
jgi:hypothetical protein